MRLGKGRMAKWFPVSLALTGSLALLIGIFVAVLSIPEVVAGGHLGGNVLMPGALYVGTNTCFTCHGDQPLDWSLTLYAQTVVDPLQKPMVMTNLGADDEIRVVDVGDMVEAYTTEDQLTTDHNLFGQYYVIQTEDGHTVFPKQQYEDEAEPGNSLTNCGTCHTAGGATKAVEIATIRLAVPLDIVAKQPIMAGVTWSGSVMIANQRATSVFGM